jgi:hypothetical protein
MIPTAKTTTRPHTIPLDNLILTPLCYVFSK